MVATSAKLYAAAEEGNTEVIKNLLQAGGVDLNAGDPKTGSTPLHRAAARGHAPAIRALLDGGADIEAEDARGRRALHWAAGSGSGQAVRALLQRGATADARDNDSDTPLHWAAGSGNIDGVQALLKRAPQRQGECSCTC